MIERSGYMTAAICRRGHVETSDISLQSEVPDRCITCGSTVITECGACSHRIRGLYLVESMWGTSGTFSKPSFCDKCGAPHPWADRQARIYELQNILDEHDLDEGNRLAVREQLEALINPDLDEQDQIERWSRIRKLAPAFMTSGQKIAESVMTAAIKAQMGL